MKVLPLALAVLIPIALSACATLPNEVAPAVPKVQTTPTPPAVPVASPTAPAVAKSLLREGLQVYAANAIYAASKNRSPADTADLQELVPDWLAAVPVGWHVHADSYGKLIEGPNAEAVCAELNAPSGRDDATRPLAETMPFGCFKSEEGFHAVFRF